MRKKVIIPNRGVVALDIIDAYKALGFETILLHSPEDSNSLPVKLVEKSFKFYSSRLEDSYNDMETIIDKALELQADYIHPGYGFLAESWEFAELCEQNNIKFIGPNSKVLKKVRDKIGLRKIASGLGIKIVPHSDLIKTPVSLDFLPSDDKYPMLIKPLNGSGGIGIRLVDYKKDAQERINKMLKQEENQRHGLFLEEFFPHAHHIELPFIRDVQGNTLFPPEIESSIQRRFQKIFQESPSPNLTDSLRAALYRDAKRLIDEIDFVGLGYVEFIVNKGTAYFSEINPSFQINTLLPELHIIANFMKKHFAICNGELLHDVKGVEIIQPRLHGILLSVMAENPFDNFQPSSGVVTEFYNYSCIRNMFKTSLYTGAKVSPLYDPYIGKIATVSYRRDHSLNGLKNFLNNIIIRGIKTNIPFLKDLLRSKSLEKGETIIDFVNLKHNFGTRKKSEEDIATATALLSAAFHMDNMKKNYKEKLETMKQPGFFKRLFTRM